MSMLNILIIVAVFALLWAMCDPRLQNDRGNVIVCDSSYRLICCGADTIAERRGILVALDYMKDMATKKEYMRYLLEQAVSVSKGFDRDYLASFLEMVKSQKAALAEEYYQAQLDSGIENLCIKIINEAIAKGTIQ